MSAEVELVRVERVADLVERWALLLIPAALVTLSGVADALCTVIALSFFVRAAVRRDVSWLAQPWLALLLAIWLYLLGRSLVSVDPSHSLLDALIWVRYPVFAVAVSRILPDPLWRDRLIIASTGAVLFLACDAIVQYLVGFDIVGRPVQPDGRLTGTFKSPRVGICIAWLFLPPLMGLLDQRRWWLAAVLGASSVLAIMLSGERMALLTVGLDVVFLAVLFPVWRRRILVAAVAAAAVFALIVALQPALLDRQVLSIWRTASGLGESHYGIIWSRALAIAAEHPIFGVGMHNYRVVCPDPAFGPVDQPDGFARCSTHPHNYYLEWLLAGGIPVLIAFIVVTVLLVRQLLKHGQPRDGLFIGLVATLLMRLWYLASNTSFFLGWSAIPLFLFVGWALAYMPARAQVPAMRNASPEGRLADGTEPRQAEPAR